MATPKILYRSAVQTDCMPFGMPQLRFPLPPTCPTQFAAPAIEQGFEQQIDQFPPAPKNTLHTAAVFGGNNAKAILTALSQPQSMPGGVGRFTGVFHVVPASWDDFPTQVVNFPGIRDVAYTGGVRDPFSRNVTVRVRHDYFVINPSGGPSLSGVLDSGGNAISVVTSKGAIPSIYRTPWRFLVSGSILATSEVTGLVKAGGITGWFETVPNTGTYQSWIGVAATFNTALSGGSPVPWDATHPPVWDGLASPATTIGQFCFQDSLLQDYAGTIVERLSYYTLAQ